MPLEKKISHSLKFSDDSGVLDVAACFRANGFGRFESTYCNHLRESRIRIPVGARYFSLLKDVRIGSGSYTISCPLGTGGSFPGVKRTQREDDRLPSSVTECGCVAAPAIRLHDVHRDGFPFNLSMDETTRQYRCKKFLINSPTTAAYAFTLTGEREYSVHTDGCLSLYYRYYYHHHHHYLLYAGYIYIYS